MNCPECGKENPDEVKNCQFCNAPINGTTDLAKPVTVRISRLAITAVIFAICGLILTLTGLIIIMLPRPLGTRSPLADMFFSISLLSLFIALILGFISLAGIERSGGRISGRNFSVGSIIISIIVGILPIGVLFLARIRSTAYRMVCGTNLAQIGMAMLEYANDYDNGMPRAGGENSIWANKISDWKAINRDKAYGLDSEGTGGAGSISSCLFLLVKYENVEPKVFICIQDFKVKKFDPANYSERDKDFTDLWDFGPEPWKHCSYSYHMPYGKYALTVSNDPDMAVAADRNPWIPSLGWKVKDISKFNPDGDRNAIKAGNAFPHKDEGQNVLFIDSHVDFQPTSFCGVNEDNIYTYQDGGDIRRSSPPQIGSQPTNRLDSLLVNDPPIE